MGKVTIGNVRETKNGSKAVKLFYDTTIQTKNGPVTIPKGRFIFANNAEDSVNRLLEGGYITQEEATKRLDEIKNDKVSSNLVFDTEYVPKKG